MKNLLLIAITILLINGCKTEETKQRYVIYKINTSDQDLDFVRPVQTGRNTDLESHLNNNFRAIEYEITFKDDYVLLENSNPNYKLVLSKEVLKDPNQTIYYSGKGSKGKASLTYTLFKSEDGKIKLAIDCSYPLNQPIFIPVQLGAILNKQRTEFARIICHLSKID